VLGTIPVPIPDETTFYHGSALEVVLHDYALYKSTFTLLYFTLLNIKSAKATCCYCFPKVAIKIMINAFVVLY